MRADEKDQRIMKETTWLSTTEASRRMGIGLRTLYRMIDAGDLPAYKFGRVIRISEEDLDDYLQRCRISPGELSHLYAGGDGSAQD